LGRELATSYGAAVEGGATMKRIAYLSILLLGAFVLLFVPAVVGAQEEQGVVPVSAYDGYFYPADITVPSGTTVVWTNEGEKPHTVTAHDGSFASGTLYPGESYQVTFYEPGTYTYQCSDSMQGSVTVI
jgi:plastocyanin